MAARPAKILFILFKYLGDVAVAIPAMRAVRAHDPDAEIHVLVAEDALPIVQHLPWITRAWGFPRKRGHAQIRATLPLLALLRRQHFSLSVDFVGNDRGALVSLIVGAQKRVGLQAPLGFAGRRFCYTHPIDEKLLPITNVHESVRHAHLLQQLGIPLPESYELEVYADSTHEKTASRLLAEGTVIGHLSTSQPKKEWPVACWLELYRRATAAGVPFVFASGPSEREQALISELLAQEPAAPLLPPTPSLDLYLAVLRRARVFIAGDTGPLHFAAGLRVPTIALFAATDATRWAPIGPQHRLVQGERSCVCSGHAHRCQQPPIHCMRSISIASAWESLRSILNSAH
ncbi:MAG: hypothetical protein RLZZ399_495 [Verrucomicrobiota bacterium]|jgi:ADP-heptose:LPS heptosyltransferase